MGSSSRATCHLASHCYLRPDFVKVLDRGNNLAAMDAIKKKMQAMKVEKDNAMDRSDVCEQASKDAKVRAGKAEEEVALAAAELEVNALNRRVQGLEGDLETCEDKLLMASQKLDKAATAADDSDRIVELEEE